MDTDGHVAYVGTFSKILAPGIRVGYLLCNKELMAKIVVAKQVSDVHTNIWAQMLCYKFLTECDLNAHLEGIRKIYDKKCSLMLSELDKHLGGKITYTRPEGGLFIWCTLPEEIDMFSFCKTAVENKVAVVPGSAFSINEGDKTNSFRINFSTPKDEQIIKGVEILGSLL
jgi:2-aminoadipate transaminase